MDLYSPTNIGQRPDNQGHKRPSGSFWHHTPMRQAEIFRKRNKSVISAHSADVRCWTVSKVGVFMKPPLRTGRYQDNPIQDLTAVVLYSDNLHIREAKGKTAVTVSAQLLRNCQKHWLDRKQKNQKGREKDRPNANAYGCF